MATAVKEIMLGNGIFSIGDNVIGATRGGGQFTVEREYRDIEVDGDRGTVKGRTVIDRSVPKLQMNLLSFIKDNLIKMYPGTKLTTETTPTAGKKLTGTSKVLDSDYNDVIKWTGKTKAGKRVIISIYNAINLENIDFALADKDEIIQTLNYTGCYLDDSPDDYEPWDVIFLD